MPYVPTVHQIKGGKSSPYSEPRPGTKRRQLWDFIYLHKGQWVEFRPEDFGFTLTTISSAIVTFRDRYGLDIRCLRVGRGHNHRWLFAGEWEGKVYIDHVIDQKNAEIAAHKYKTKILLRSHPRSQVEIQLKPFDFSTPLMEEDIEK